jgi:hypothetical protein
VSVAGTKAAQGSAATKSEPKPSSPPKEKRRYFCEGTGVEIDHKVRFAGMGFDAQLKSRLVNAALEGKPGVRYDNLTGKAIKGPAEQLLADLGWTKFLTAARDSRAAKTAKREARAAAKLSAEADKASGSDDDEDEDE